MQWIKSSLLEESDLHWYFFNIQSYRAEAYLQMGMKEQAREAAQKCLEIYGEDEEAKMSALILWGEVLTAYQEFGQAEQAFLEAEKIISERKDRYIYSEMLVSKADMYLHMGRHTEAVKLLKEAWSLYEDIHLQSRAQEVRQKHSVLTSGVF